MPILNMGSGGIDTSDATADAGKILYPYTAYKDGEKVTGSIPSLAAQSITPGTADQIIASGQYLAGAQTIKGDANLIAGNIVSGKTIFGVAGSAAVATTVEITSLELYDDGTYSYVQIPVSGVTQIKALGVAIKNATFLDDGSTVNSVVTLSYIPSTQKCVAVSVYGSGYMAQTDSDITLNPTNIRIWVGTSNMKITSLSGASFYGAISYV
jgi:hypothetical protein